MGVFLTLYNVCYVGRTLPHARGGVSNKGTAALSAESSSPRPWGCFSNSSDIRRARRSSPRPWGCFCKRAYFYHARTLFPTPVGVFLTPARGAAHGIALPHARGGVSSVPNPIPAIFISSPRPWGVFLHRTTAARRCGSLPHARGGGSLCFCPIPGAGFHSGIGHGFGRSLFPLVNSFWHDDFSLVFNPELPRGGTRRDESGQSDPFLPRCRTPTGGRRA